MSLRKKVFLYSLLPGLCFLLGLTFLLHNFYLKSYGDLEKKQVQASVKRIESALKNRLNVLDVLTSDWAAWNDTYQFVVDENDTFLKSNVTTSTFIDANLDLILIANKEKKIVFSSSINNEERKLKTVSYDVLRYFSKDSIFLNHFTIKSSYSCIIRTQDQPMLIASRPIITSDALGPIRGSLVMGRYLDKIEMDKMIGVTHESLMFFDLGKKKVSTKLNSVVKDIDVNHSYVEVLNDKYVYGYFLSFDCFKDPFMLFRIKMKRTFFQQGKLNFYSFMFIFLGSCFVFAFIAIIILDRLVLSRLALLVKEVAKIGETSDFSARVSIDGADELSRCNMAINDMLAQLETALNDLNTLSGLLPICCHCKSIRDDKGYWSKLETFISKRSDAQFSHSLCPNCLKTLYPKAYERYEQEQKKKLQKDKDESK